MPLNPQLVSAATCASPIRVVVVDDSALIRALLNAIIARHPDMMCVGMAADPLQARELIRELDPDVVTLDLVMPHMDGLDFLERLMRLRPTPVVIIASRTTQHEQLVERALALGAAGVVDKPVGHAGGLEQVEQDIVQQIRQAARQRTARRRVGVSPTSSGSSLGAGAHAHSSPSSALASPAASPAVGHGSAASAATPAPSAVAAVALGSVDLHGRLIAIGASTGGTEATPRVLARLTAAVPPIVIVQHIPGGFSARYAERLNTCGPVRVSEARDGEVLKPGHAYVAPGGLHLAVERSGGHYVARVLNTDPVLRHRPSVDVLFRSVAKAAGDKAIGIMLTGMGGDGAQAMRVMRDAGAFNIAQDEASCTIFGMPREAIRCGACQEVLSLEAIGPRVLAQLGLAASACSPAAGLRTETSTADR